MPKAESTPKKYHQTSHGPEIFPRRPPVLTSTEMEWREAVVSFLQERSPTALANLSSASEPVIIKESQTAYRVGNDTPLSTSFQPDEFKSLLRERLTEDVLIPLRIINEILKVQFGSPDLGNQKKLIDELVYILLTRRSKIEDAQKHLSALKRKYPAWEEAAFVPAEELKATIMGGGLEDHKVKFIQASLQFIHERFGRIDEADFVSMSDWQLDQFLQELPGVGKKTSACILMYARGADIFPADTHCIRVLDRLGIFKNFGLAWRQEDHKKAQNELPLLLMPPHIRGDLHRNLVVLGKEICKQTPECHRCELKKFCTYYRTEAQSINKEEKKNLAIDMFCGAGGFSLGLSRAGFKIVAAVDNNPDAIRTYRLNHPEMPDEAVIEGDAHQVDLDRLHYLLGDRKLDLLAGGPPCQGFSMMGNRVPHKFENGDKKFGSNYNFSEDERNHLFEAMIDVARELQPCYVVIENVPGLGSAKVEEKSYAEFIRGRLEAISYKAEIISLEASNFGVPQKRHRYFIFGAHEGNRLPVLKTLADGIPEVERTNLEHALHDLPILTIADGTWIAAHSNGIERNRELDDKYLTRFDVRGYTQILYSHISRFNNDDDVELFENLQQGEDYQQLIERIGWQVFTKYSSENFHDKYYRLRWDGQSKTIVSHLARDGNSFVHPFQIRSLSVREAARIQSFPDDYILCGSRKAQFIQIGNAVPPIMAEVIGRTLIEALVNDKS